jgi:hypothetical protein
MTSFLHLSIPQGSLHSLFGAWQISFKKIVFLSAPAHLLTVILCIANLRNPSPTNTAAVITSSLWGLGILFTLLHAYPAGSRGGAGMEFFRLSEEGWKGRSRDERKRLI